MFERDIITSGDGSHTIAVAQLGERYHSIHGALTETLHVFIRNGLDFYVENTHTGRINIFEMGFGTGLNTLAALSTAKHIRKQIFYTALEAFPLEEREYGKLNFEKHLRVTENAFKTMHCCPWNEFTEIDKDFYLKKINAKFQDFEPEDGIFDVIFFDAFSPNKQPELWTEDTFRKMYSALTQNGVLVTYCAKGAVRRAMQAAGFSVQRLEGPPHKREMLRAVK